MLNTHGYSAYYAGIVSRHSDSNGLLARVEIFHFEIISRALQEEERQTRVFPFIDDFSSETLYFTISFDAKLDGFPS